VSNPSYRAELKRARSGGYHRSDPIENPVIADESTGLLSGSGTARHSYQTGFFSYENRPVRWLFLALKPVFKLLKSSPVHLLLVVLPFCLFATLLRWPPIVQFVLSFVSIISLSSLNLFVLDDLSMRLGQTVGGLANAAFGNTIEIAVRRPRIPKDQTVY
jgi:Ca2+:H+ antiporter